MVLALLLGPLPEFASMSTQTNAPVSSEPSPIYNPTGGPNGNGDISFDTGNQQLMNMKADTLNFASHGGFTFVALVKFTTDGTNVVRMPVVTLEGGSGYIVIRRASSGNTSLSFHILDSNGKGCFVWSRGEIITNVWLSLEGKYDYHTQKISLRLGNGLSAIDDCSSQMSNLYFTNARIGGGDPGFQGCVAGLLIVDALLDNAEINSIIDNMYVGEDVLRAGRTFSVAVGAVAGHGASVPVSFVDGGRYVKVQWGVMSVPVAFTIYSVTRYTRELNKRILSCGSNPLGDANFVHGHTSGNAGVTLYGDGQDTTDSYKSSISPNTDWVVVCGRNIETSNSDSVIVNGVTKSIASGGVGSCALGINHLEQSYWQLSKLCIWDYHLSDENFALASTSLYAALSNNIRDDMCLSCPIGTFQSNTASTTCTHCPVDSTTYDTNSKYISDCKCRPGYAGRDGGQCLPCLASTFKRGLGSTCSACQKGKYNSMVGSNLSTFCL